MKKILFITSSLILSVVWVLWYNYYKTIYPESSIKEHKIIKNELKTLNDEKNNTVISEPLTKTKDEKIETLRKRFSLRGTIARWDNFFEWSQPVLALNEYLKALRQNPKDEQIIKKLAVTYYELKRYKDAVAQYSKIESFLLPEDMHSYILSLLYLANFKSAESVQITTDKIKSLSISEEEKFYYLTNIWAVNDLHATKKAFEEYFIKTPQIHFKPLGNIQTAFTNFKNFQVNDIYYKDALYIGAIFQDRLFSISNILAEKLLLEKPNYKPMLLVIGKGYYEIWDLKNAKTYLEKYYALEPKDTTITYILGTINFKMKEYVTSNLYYNAAIKNWFEPKIELQRKLAYNYYLSNDKRSMLNMFSYLLNEKDANIDDFSLGIYHAILEGRTLNAQRRSDNGLKKFANQEWHEIFYAYLWWIKREEKDLVKSREYLQAGLKINPKNPLLTLNMWYLEEFEEKYKMALMYLKRTVNINGDGEFGELAKKEMSEIEKFLDENDTQSASGIISQ